MNQWILAFLIFWLGTGALVTATEIAKIMKGRSK